MSGQHLHRNRPPLGGSAQHRTVPRGGHPLVKVSAVSNINGRRTRGGVMRNPPDLVCVSAVPWSEVSLNHQSRLGLFAEKRRVFFIEPAKATGAIHQPRSALQCSSEGVWVSSPQLPDGLSALEAAEAEHELLDFVFDLQAVRDFVVWRLDARIRGRPSSTVQSAASLRPPV